MFILFQSFLLTIVAKWFAHAPSQTDLANQVKNLKVLPEGEGLRPIARTIETHVWNDEGFNQCINALFAAVVSNVSFR